jgi:hypothetical protein
MWFEWLQFCEVPRSKNVEANRLGLQEVFAENPAAIQCLFRTAGGAQYENFEHGITVDLSSRYRPSRSSQL